MTPQIVSGIRIEMRIRIQPDRSGPETLHLGKYQINKNLNSMKVPTKSVLLELSLHGGIGPELLKYATVAFSKRITEFKMGLIQQVMASS
jgi:hypothetical protein